MWFGYQLGKGMRGISGLLGILLMIVGTIVFFVVPTIGAVVFMAGAVIIFWSVGWLSFR